jgi:hypothetical protein
MGGPRHSLTGQRPERTCSLGAAYPEKGVLTEIAAPLRPLRFRRFPMLEYMGKGRLAAVSRLFAGRVAVSDELCRGAPLIACVRGVLVVVCLIFGRLENRDGLFVAGFGW